MENISKELLAVFNRHGVKGKDARAALESALPHLCRELGIAVPPWSTLDHLLIEDTQKATIGSGVCVVFQENDITKVVLGKAGAHYKLDQPAYTIPGGFINLTYTEGSALVPKSDKPENPRIGCAREVEEEFRNDKGEAILRVDPARLTPMDMDVVSPPSGQVIIVQGLMLELNQNEVLDVKDHVRKLQTNASYKQAVASQTINPSSNLPEIDDVAIFDLADVAQGKVNLLHADQQTLFKIVHAHFTTKSASPPRYETGLRPK